MFSVAAVSPAENLQENKNNPPRKSDHSSILVFYQNGRWVVTFRDHTDLGVMQHLCAHTDPSHYLPSGLSWHAPLRRYCVFTELNLLPIKTNVLTQYDKWMRVVSAWGQKSVIAFNVQMYWQYQHDPSRLVQRGLVMVKLALQLPASKHSLSAAADCEA